MKRGMIFSIDAIFSVIFVVTLAASFSLYQTTSTIDTFLVGNFNLQTTDAALVAYYLDLDASDFEGIENALIGTDVNQSNCVTIPKYVLNGDGVSTQTIAGINPNTFCREIK